MLAEGLLERPDGRVVAWTEWGDPKGKPLVRLHGTPGCRLMPVVPGDVYDRVGAHVVTLDRPGYGRSTPQPDRTWTSCADDAVAIADAMGWGAFSVYAQSGGAAQALAIAVRSPSRVRSLGLHSPAVPPELEEIDDLDDPNREAILRAREGRESLEAFMKPYADRFMADAATTFDELTGDSPQEDVALMEDEDRRAGYLEMAREAFVNGAEGWYADAWALYCPQGWGFELSDVRAPVHIWYGAADYGTASVERLAASLDDAAIERLPGGHLATAEEFERELRTLLAA